jgi:hypothetical protein
MSARASRVDFALFILSHQRLKGTYHHVIKMNNKIIPIKNKSASNESSLSEPSVIIPRATPQLTHHDHIWKYAANTNKAATTRNPHSRNSA